MKPIIEVKNLSKEYILTHNVQPYYTLRDFLTNFVKKPFEYFSSKNFSTKKEKFMALKDVNFSVMPGEVIGIIGRNGAGKSTLLKILSQITPPTSGSIHLRGRVASLLEVGTGFHPELTGRENIFLNGAILGMTQKEIKSKFNEIVEFAGIEKFLDTPVKRYSSGMYVRLAFAVAAHLEPEILIVDEVLAVGDAEFQKKCLGKMGDIAKQDGRTVLFVSHNMAAIKQLCKKAILLDKGGIVLSGEVGFVVEHYLRRNNDDDLKAEKNISYQLDKIFQLVYAKVCDEELKLRGIFESDENIVLLFGLKIKEKIPGLYAYLQISKKESDVAVLISDSNDVKMNFFDHSPLGDVKVKVIIPKRSLGVGEYIVYINFTSDRNVEGFNVDSPGDILSFKINDNNTTRGNNRGGYFSTLLDWKFINN
jgi:lipopolysaccharide transport system ATP-binding protein